MKPQSKININPIPIFIFSSQNTWYSLSTGMLQAYIENSSISPFFYFHQPNSNILDFMLDKIIADKPPGIWIFSNYIWNVEKQLEYSKKIKQLSPDSITIHGGPSTPKYKKDLTQFLTKNNHIDITVHGEGELIFFTLLDKLKEYFGALDYKKKLIGISGISFLDSNQQLSQGAPHPRIKDLNSLPSPYLTGVFNKKPNIWENQYLKTNSATLETNRGCPYKCTFCDWGSLTQQKIKLFDLERVKAEINWLVEHKIKHIFIADANFGIFERDLEIAKYITEVKKETGYPEEIIVNYAKNATDRIAKITKLWISVGLTAQGVISIQTTDENTLNVIKRSNIKTDKYDALASRFEEMGLPISTDLMIGLPGATLESFKKDLQRYFDKNVLVKAYPTVLLPNSPMAEPTYRKENKIEIDNKGKLIATFSYSRMERKSMSNLYNHYHLFENLGYLRYILRYLQWDYQIPALELIDKLISASLYTVKNFVKNRKSYYNLLNVSPKDRLLFYQEIKGFLIENIPNLDRSTYEMIEKVNKAIIPNKEQSYPLELRLPHNITDYFFDRQKRKVAKNLQSYPPGNFLIENVDDFRNVGLKKQLNVHQVFWELKNPMRRHQSKPNYID